MLVLDFDIYNLQEGGLILMSERYLCYLTSDNLKKDIYCHLKLAHHNSRQKYQFISRFTHEFPFSSNRQLLIGMTLSWITQCLIRSKRQKQLESLVNTIVHTIRTVLCTCISWNHRVLNFTTSTDRTLCCRFVVPMILMIPLLCLEICFLSNDIHDYYIVSQGKTTIPSMDDGEECTLTDVSCRWRNSHGRLETPQLFESPASLDHSLRKKPESG